MTSTENDTPHGLRPLPFADLPTPDCPRCGGATTPGPLRVPGNRVLVDAGCPACGADLICDLPTSFAILGRDLFDRGTGTFPGEPVLPFWRKWLKQILDTPRDDPLAVEVCVEAGLKRPLFLHCLDPIFGHGLKRLLHATAYQRHYPDRPLVPIVSPDLVPFLPDGIAGHIRVDWPADARHAWNTDLEAALSAAFAQHEDPALCQTVPSLATDAIDITRHSKTAPFPRDEWTDRPVLIGLIWRDTRCWGGSPTAQAQAFGAFATALHAQIPNATVAVTGIAAELAPLPDGLTDHRRTLPCSAEDERAMLALYAAAHVVIGSHGSNMLLPSAHAGSTIELVLPKRWHNAWTASLFRDPADAASTAFYHRYLPMETTPATVADVARAIVQFAPRFELLGSARATGFDSADPAMLEARGYALPPHRR